jgi:hypothetical protein
MAVAKERGEDADAGLVATFDAAILDGERAAS